MGIEKEIVMKQNEYLKYANELTEDDELNLQAREEMMDAEADTEPDVVTDDQLKMEAEALARHEAEQASISIANYSRETHKTFFEIFK